MQLSIDEAEAFLNETAESFPAALFDELNGGVNLLDTPFIKQLVAEVETIFFSD